MPSSSPGDRRSWFGRSGVLLADQALSTATNFLVSGAVLFLLPLDIMGVHTSLLSVQAFLLVVVRGLFAERFLTQDGVSNREELGRSLVAAATIGVGGSVLLGAASFTVFRGSDAALGIVGFCLAMPLVALQEVYRFGTFRVRPLDALISDGIWFLAAGIGIALAAAQGEVTYGHVVWAWLGGLLLAVVPTTSLVMKSVGATRPAFDRVGWSVSADQLLSRGGLLVVVWLVTTISGEEATGLYGVVRTMFGPVTVAGMFLAGAGVAYVDRWRPMRRLLLASPLAWAFLLAVGAPALANLVDIRTSQLLVLTWLIGGTLTIELIAIGVVGRLRARRRVDGLVTLRAWSVVASCIVIGALVLVHPEFGWLLVPLSIAAMNLPVAFGLRVRSSV